MYMFIYADTLFQKLRYTDGQVMQQQEFLLALKFRPKLF